MKRTILITIAACFSFLAFFGCSQKESYQENNHVPASNIHYTQEYDSSGIKVKYVMTKDYTLSRTVTTARFASAFIKLYGDSIITKFIDENSRCIMYLILNNDGTIKRLDIIQHSRNPECFYFINKHKWELLKEFTSTYDYLYAVVNKEYPYADNLTRSRYKPMQMFFPLPHFNEPFMLEDPVEKLRYVLDFENKPIETSIDDGLHPDDYDKYEYNPVDTFLGQKNDYLGFHI